MIGRPLAATVGPRRGRAEEQGGIIVDVGIGLPTTVPDTEGRGRPARRAA
jgi:hypothetical protein